MECDDIFAQARAVYASKQYVVMFRARCYLEDQPAGANTDKVVLHVVGGVVTLLLFKSFDPDKNHLFELEGATSTFAGLTLDEAIRFGAELLRFNFGMTSDYSVLGMELYVRRGGEPNDPTVDGTEASVVSHYTDCEQVVACEVGQDSFERPMGPDGVLCYPRVEWHGVLGHAVWILELAIRTYV